MSLIPRIKNFQSRFYHIRKNSVCGKILLFICNCHWIESLDFHYELWNLTPHYFSIVNNGVQNHVKQSAP